jgi:hypothetical protein
MRKSLAVLALVATSVGLAGALPACGGNDEPYKPVPAFSGRKASLPSVPTLPSTPIKNGDAYTIYGAIHHLRSRIHSQDVTAKDISLVGYIVESNIETAPECAIHKTGKADPENCKAEIPTFVLADQKGEKTATYRIKVMGWASNFANVFDAIEAYKNLKAPPDEKHVVNDELWAVPVPFPLPAVGAKVKVTGKYGVNFSKSSTGLAADPQNGIMTYAKIETLEEAPEKAAFPKKK